MNDTHNKIDVLYKNMIMAKSPEDRLMMGFSMYDTSRQIVESRIYNQNPGITEQGKKEKLFLIFYENDFSEKEKGKILKAFKKSLTT